MRHDEKRRYPRETTAIRAALRASRRTGQPLRTYHCPQCNGWHLTSWAHPAAGDGREAS